MGNTRDRQNAGPKPASSRAKPKTRKGSEKNSKPKKTPRKKK
jgi:hypothetical protein